MCPHTPLFEPTETPAEGLYRKFDVKRTDGTSAKGHKHENCDYLVLDWVHDRFAVPAALAYADACEAEYPELAADIRTRAKRATDRSEICRGCGLVLHDTNRTMADGCHCNSRRGINHGRVDKLVCTCAECDPAQTGSSRWRP
jgi:hypothetical protein